MLTESTYGFSRPRPITLASGPAYLDSVLTSTVMDLDATIAASYGGSGTTWANLTAAPADGVVTTAYDFYMGDGSTGSTYPAFNGTAGNPAAYWSVDGGDYFRLKTLTGTLPEKWHRTTGGSNWWVAITFRTPSGIFTGTRAFFGNAGSAVNRGVLGYTTASEQLSMITGNNSAAPNTTVSGTGAMAGSTDYIFILSMDTSGTTNNLRRWLNSGTATAYSHTLGTSTTNSTDNFYLFATKSNTTEGAIPMENGARLYSFAMGNEFLDNAKAASLITHLNGRHARTYA